MLFISLLEFCWGLLVWELPWLTHILKIMKTHDKISFTHNKYNMTFTQLEIFALIAELKALLLQQKSWEFHSRQFPMRLNH